MSAKKLPSKKWLAAWRKAREALAMYSHIGDPTFLDAFKKHVKAMHDLDATETAQEVRRMVDEFPIEWDPNDPVQPAILRKL